MKLTSAEELSKLFSKLQGNPNVQFVDSNDPSVQGLFPQLLQRSTNADLKGPLEPVFYAKPTERLLIADKPPALGGVVKSISVKDFCEQDNIQWSDAPLIHQKRRQNLFQKVAAVSLEVHTFQTWNHGANHFVIADMSANQDSQYKSVGKGAFYHSKKKKPLPAGVCVGNYSGVIVSQGDGKFYPNGFLAGRDKSQTNTFWQLYGRAIYDAQNVQNITTLFQHAPLEEDLEKIEMPEHLKKLVLTANLVPNGGVNSPVPTVSFISRRDIQDGEPLCYPYGNYWKDMDESKAGDGSFALFDIDGDIIGTVNLQNRFTVNPKYNPQGKRPTPRCNSEANDKVCYFVKESTKVNQDCAIIFINNTRFIANFHLNRKKLDGKSYYEKNDLAVIMKIQTICSHYNPNQVFEELEAFKNKLKVSHKHLEPLILELSIQLNFYKGHRQLLESNQKTTLAATHTIPQQPTAARLDELTMKVLYSVLKQNTIEKGWKMDTQQNFWIEGDEALLRQIRAHLESFSVTSSLQKAANSQQFRLKLHASSLLNKPLTPMNTSDTKKESVISLDTKK